MATNRTELTLVEGKTDTIRKNIAGTIYALHLVRIKTAEFYKFRQKCEEYECLIYIVMNAPNMDIKTANYQNTIEKPLKLLFS